MSRDTSWAERTSWTKVDEADFFARLKRAHKRNRPSLLVRQAGVLATSDWPEGNRIALELLREAEKHGVDDWTRSAFYRLLAECEWQRGENDAALAAYRLAFAAEDALPTVRNGLQIAFAWEVAKRRLRGNYDEALARLEPVPNDPLTLAWPANRYRYFGALAVFTSDLGDSQEAGRLARIALTAAAAEEGPVPRHAKLGRVAPLADEMHALLARLAAA